MTKLSTTIDLKYVKQSRALQEIKCEKNYYIHQESDSSFISTPENIIGEVDELFPAPTIADVIDNAEMLFRKKKKKRNKSMYIPGMGINSWKEVKPNYKTVIKTIIHKCICNKSIDEISKYIIENIK